MPHKRSKDGRYKQRYRQTLYENETEERYFRNKKEQDIANAIVKEHCTRDPVTGEIAYNPSKKPLINYILLGAEYRFEVEDDLQPPKAIRDQQGIKTHYEEHNKIRLATIERVLNHSDFEVLNRASMPCWWRSP